MRGDSVVLLSMTPTSVVLVVWVWRAILEEREEASSEEEERRRIVGEEERASSFLVLSVNRYHSKHITLLTKVPKDEY